MQLAHAGDAGLAALFVRVDAEGGVLLGQALQGHRQLVLVGLGLGLDGDLDHRLGEDDRLEHDRVIRVAQGVAGEGLLEADGGGDVAGVDRVDLFAVVGVHLEDAADPLLLALGGVEDVGAGLQRPGVDPEVGQLADVRIRGDLEGQGAEGLLVVGGAQDFVVRCRVLADDRRHVQGRGQVVDHRVEHGWTPLFLSADPARTGTIRYSSVPRRRPRLMSSGLRLWPSRYL